jgi:hypothetical protein
MTGVLQGTTPGTGRLCIVKGQDHAKSIQGDVAQLYCSFVNELSNSEVSETAPYTLQGMLADGSTLTGALASQTLRLKLALGPVASDGTVPGLHGDAAFSRARACG